MTRQRKRSSASRVSQQVVNAEKLRKGAGFGVGGLRGEHRIAEPLVVVGKQLREERFVE